MNIQPAHSYKPSGEEIANKLAGTYTQENDYTLDERSAPTPSDLLARLPNIEAVKAFKPHIIETALDRYPAAPRQFYPRGRKIKKYYRKR